MSRKFPPAQGTPPSIEWVGIGALEIDDTYQRSTDTKGSQRLIAAIANSWDWGLVDVLKVSQRPDDRRFVIDGQHRRAAATMRGDIFHLPCVVKRCSGPEEEARLFIAANRGRKAMSKLDDFRAAVGSGDEESVLIHGMIEKAGLKVPRHYVASAAGPGEIASIVGLQQILRRHGKEVLERVLSLIGEAFPDEVLITPMPMIHAIAHLLAVRRPTIAYDDLFGTLLSGTTAEWAVWAGLQGLRGGIPRINAVIAAIEAKAMRLEEAA